MFSGNVILTGHSPGGGLAGLLASIYGQTAYIYDSMSFESAARNLISATATPAIDTPMRQLYFQGAEPHPFNSAGIFGSQIDLQALAGMQAVSSTQKTYALGFSGILSDLDRHSVSLLVIRTYAAGLPNSDWMLAARFVLPDLYNDTIAQTLGLESGGSTGTDTASGKMRTEIAYSAIDQGTTIYGNTAIGALFHDANYFGQILQLDGVAQYLTDPTVDQAIGNIITEYAGLLAVNRDTNSDHAAGVIGYDPANKVWTANFSPDLWTKTATGGQAQILGKQPLIDSAMKFAGEDPRAVQPGVDKLWGGSTDNIIKLIGATKDSDPTLDATGPDGIADQNGNVPAGKGALLIGGTGNDQLIGAKGDNLMIGGGGNDTFTGGTGNDLMFGGSADDTFILGYGGSDWVDGGGGNDTAKYTGSNDPLTVTLSAANGRNLPARYRRPDR